MQYSLAKHIPIVTILMLIIHTGCYLLFERFDGHIEQKLAINMLEYSDSNAFIDSYVRYMQKKMAYDIYLERLQQIQDGKTDKKEVYMWMHSDPFYQNWLMHHPIPFEKLSKTEVEQLRAFDYLKQQSGLYRFGFIPLHAKWQNMLTSMFLHQYFMLFLLVILLIGLFGGYAELKYSALSYLMLYGLGGAFAIAVLALINPLYPLPLTLSLAAQSFVAGIIIGRLRIQISSLLGCALIGLYCLLMKWYSPFSLVIACITLILGWGICWSYAILYGISKRIGVQDVQNTLAYKKKTIRALIDDYEYTEAKTNINKLLESHPNDRDLKFLYFDCCKQNPSSREFHDSAKVCFSIPESDRLTTAQMNLVFKSYKQKAIPCPKWNVNVLVKLLQRFRKHGYFEDSEWILRELTLNYKEMLFDTIAHETFLLARDFLSKQDKHKGTELMEKCATQFAVSLWGKRARDFLRP